jgi:hypothetical protein
MLALGVLGIIGVVLLHLSSGLAAGTRVAEEYRDVNSLGRYVQGFLDCSKTMTAIAKTTGPVDTWRADGVKLTNRAAPWTKVTKYNLRAERPDVANGDLYFYYSTIKSGVVVWEPLYNGIPIACGELSLALTQSICGSSGLFRREVTHPMFSTSPKFTPSNYYMAGVSYTPSSGGADGAMNIRYCSAQSGIFTGASCSYSGWLLNSSKTCNPGEYVQGVDYAASAAMAYPPGGVEGRARVRCCQATPPPEYTFKQTSCAWTPWADTDGVVRTCPLGKYAAGFSYNDGSSSGYLGRARILCCKP